MTSIYLDHNATSVLRPQVLEAMLPYWHKEGNPASVHRHGRLMRQAIETAREQIAAFVHAHPSEVIFTSGGTEANNLAIRGFAAAQSAPGSILVGSLEHDCVLKTAQSLTQFGWEIVALPSDETGRYEPAVISQLFAKHAFQLCSLMLANNETGVIEPIAALADIARHHGALFHTDAVQALGKMPVNFEALGVDMMTLSAHKIGGPIGVGALIKRAHVPLNPLLYGGAQEQGLRAGTENTALIIGFGRLCELLQAEQHHDQQRMQALQKTLESKLADLPDVQILAAQGERLPNTTLLAVRHVEGEMLLMALDKKGVSVSSGSACGNLKAGGSHVLQAMGVPEPWASNTIRVSLGWNSSESDCDAFVIALQEVLQAAQSMSWGAL